MNGRKLSRIGVVVPVIGAAALLVLVVAFPPPDHGRAGQSGAVPPPGMPEADARLTSGEPSAVERQTGRISRAIRSAEQREAALKAVPGASLQATQRLSTMRDDFPAHYAGSIQREGYPDATDNPVHPVSQAPVSTFSVDVDTASYANVRRFLSAGRLPPAASVRVEELINYFTYDYPLPKGDDPFTVYTEIGPSPWHADRHLLHIGLKAAAPADDAMGPANLVFLVDVSGSMRSDAKLPLLKQSLRLLTSRLSPQDSVALVVYAGAAGVVLEPTPASERARILAAIDRLEAGGSTNGGAGIALAYDLAMQRFAEDGVNRVILATDGDFNVGTVSHEALEELVERRRDRGVALTVLGFGSGNYQDGLMQRLAQIGNGNAAYIDSIHEARKVLADELDSTLSLIASDVKIQVEFNPAVVAEYRLVGYETRKLDREDFLNDRVDAGDVGAGHTVTALYELALHGSEGKLISPLRYGSRIAPESRPAVDDEFAHVRLRFKQPGEDQSVLREYPVRVDSITQHLSDNSVDFRFSAAVAAYGQLLTGGRYTGEYGFADALDLARAARGADPYGYRGAFLELLQTARALADAEASQAAVRH